jgi:1-acyl-sn-glycerol-3-phosphate acyltransferase
MMKLLSLCCVAVMTLHKHGKSDGLSEQQLFHLITRFCCRLFWLLFMTIFRQFVNIEGNTNCAAICMSECELWDPGIFMLVRRDIKC